ncbi:MAG: hypothetical protein ACXWIN_00390 [Burkholderiaceae bacterium]
MRCELLLADGSNIDQISPTVEYVVMSFGRQNVERGLCGDALDRLISLSDSEAFVSQFADRMTFQFEGYDRDRREVWQIPECVYFFRKLTEQWPYWYHFLEKDGPSISIALHLLCEMRLVKVKNGRVGSTFVNPEELRVVAMRLFDGMNVLYEHHGIDEVQNEAMSKKVNDALLRL